MPSVVIGQFMGRSEDQWLERTSWRLKAGLISWGNLHSPKGKVRGFWTNCTHGAPFLTSFLLYQNVILVGLSKLQAQSRLSSNLEREPQYPLVALDQFLIICCSKLCSQSRASRPIDRVRVVRLGLQNYIDDGGDCQRIRCVPKTSWRCRTGREAICEVVNGHTTVPNQSITCF